MNDEKDIPVRDDAALIAAYEQGTWTATHTTERPRKLRARWNGESVGVDQALLDKWDQPVDIKDEYFGKWPDDE